MVHVGKYVPVNFDRDLCGEFPQLGAHVAPKRWEFIRLQHGSGTLAEYLRTHRRRSFPAYRIDGEQHLQWEWDLSDIPLGGYLEAQQIWDPVARTLECRFHAECSGLTHADMTKVWYPMLSTYQAWKTGSTYTTHSTTNSAVWNWGTGSDLFVHLSEAGWPDEPNP